MDRGTAVDAGTDAPPLTGDNGPTGNPTDAGILNSDAPDARPLVLIVDDNVDHLAFLRLAVGARYRVASASNGFEAYELACRVRPDAILLDLVMPILDGYSVVRKLSQNPATTGTPVIFVTGLDPDALGPLPEGSAVLRKPCHQGEILDAIQRALAP